MVEITRTDVFEAIFSENKKGKINYSKIAKQYNCDLVIANAIIDRLVHRCEIVKITGISYRIKGKSIFDEKV